MNCPHCGSTETNIEDGRKKSRRRRCGACGGYFDTTVQEVQDLSKPSQYEIERAGQLRDSRDRRKG